MSKELKINNTRKKYFHSEKYFHIFMVPSINQILALLATVQSDKEDEIDELMNDFDTEFIAPE